MIFPDAFTSRMNTIFLSHPEWNPDVFYASFNEKPWKGIRFNRLKVHEADHEHLLRAMDSDDDPVPWCADGFYVHDVPYAKDPYYHAGVFYIQEPSAMLPAEVLAVQPGENVLDLCAAPGGKATRLGSDMKGEGILVANEISADRSRALLRNIELFGIRNAVITNETPNRLEKKFPAFFDRILIDAPCSGEGMFRRDPNAIKSWERFGPASCEQMQREILTSAHNMLRNGGHMVYATCTFNSGENEDMIDWFLQTYPEYTVIMHPDIAGVTQSSGQKFSGSMRIWPHLSRGEGHFCVHLKKTTASADEISRVNHPVRRHDPSQQYTSRAAKEAVLSFAKSVFTDRAFTAFAHRVESQFLLYGDKIHLLPVSDLLFDGCKVVKMGDFPGEVRTTPQGRIFIPSHAFARTLAKSDVCDDHVLSFSRDDARCIRYLRGETIMLLETECLHLAQNAYILLCIDSFPIGWGKSNGASLKNLYPKAWRIQ